MRVERIYNLLRYRMRRKLEPPYEDALLAFCSTLTGILSTINCSAFLEFLGITVFDDFLKGVLQKWETAANTGFKSWYGPYAMLIFSLVCKTMHCILWINHLCIVLALRTLERLIIFPNYLCNHPIERKLGSRRVDQIFEVFFARYIDMIVS